jgi:hypothetical protein
MFNSTDYWTPPQRQKSQKVSHSNVTQGRFQSGCGPGVRRLNSCYR